MNICTIFNVLLALSQTHMDTPANQVEIAKVIQYTQQECAKLTTKIPAKTPEKAEAKQ